MKRPLLLILFLVFSFPIFAQVTLTTSPYVENFNGIATGLPNGFSIRLSSNATSLGTAAALTTAPTAWNNATGAFKNFASATGLTSASSTTDQNAATNRSLGIRQTGAIGDPGAAFVFQIANTTGKSALKLSFDLQSLDNSSPRAAAWVVDYGFGATPTTFTPATSTGTLITGGSTFSSNAITVDFGAALDNNARPVWIRIITLNTTTGSGNRPSSAIDNFNLTFTSGSAVVPTLAANPNDLSFGNQNVGSVSASQSYTLSGANLTGNVSVSATAPFSISKDNNTFSNSLTYTTAEEIGRAHV